MPTRVYHIELRNIACVQKSIPHKYRDRILTLRLDVRIGMRFQ